MNDLDRVKPSRIRFDDVDINQLQQILMSGTLDALTPEEREYFSLMELVRGLRARMRFANGRTITKAGIIKMLKNEPYSLSDWMARRVYDDSLNFFYAHDNVRPEAFANLYAEKVEKWADAAFLSGRFKEAKSLIELAGKYRGCFKKQEVEIPEELLQPHNITIYTANREDLGLPAIDRKELESLIDSIPEVPTVVRENLKEDARIKKFNLKNRMIYDVEEFSEEDSEG